jgi:fibronectin-binding autotransporter adhesin
LTIDSGAVLDFAGEATIAGTVSGAGTLEFGGGSTTFDSGAELSVADWTLGGSGNTLDENLAYGGAFTANAGVALDLSGGNLTLTGTDVFSGAATSGSQVLYAEGTTIVLGRTVGGTTTFDDTSEVIESGGSAKVGDAAGDVATLTIAAAAAWDILDNSGIKRGSSTASSIGNSGLIEKTGGTRTSTITPKVANDGTILVSSGTLDLKGAVSGGTAATPGTDTIAGASTLEFGSAVGTSKTIGSQDVGFTGGGTLDLADPKGFWGDISGFAPTDAVDLRGSWAISSFHEVSGIGKLTLESGTTKHTFDFVGNFTQSSFNIVSGTGTTTITHT